MITTQEAMIHCLQQQLDYLREQFHVKRIGLLGSFAIETATSTSDVDLVIEVCSLLEVIDR